MRDRLRQRAASDLSCPPAEMGVDDTGLGGWRVTGCGRRASYVCSHGVCVLQGEVLGHTSSAPVNTRIGAWSCAVSGAGSGDVERLVDALTPHEAGLTGCGATRVVLGTNEGYSPLQVLGASPSLECVETELGSAHVESRSAMSIRCSRGE